jgi:outer membrane cobalamin receptor
LAPPVFSQEADMTEKFMLQVAVRAEDFNEFGNTTDFNSS